MTGGTCGTSIWQRSDYGGDRRGFRCVQNGGIKAAEKTPRKEEEPCHVTELLIFFIFSGLQNPHECSYQ